MEALQADPQGASRLLADFHELRQDFNPPKPVGKSAFCARFQYS